MYTNSKIGNQMAIRELLSATQFFQDCPHRFASTLSEEGTSSSYSQVSIPTKGHMHQSSNTGIHYSFY